MDGYGRRQIPTLTLPNLELATRSLHLVVNPPRSRDRADPVDGFPCFKATNRLTVAFPNLQHCNATPPNHSSSEPTTQPRAIALIQSMHFPSFKATNSLRSRRPCPSACVRSYRYTVSRFRWVCYLKSCKHEAQHGHRDDQVVQYV